MTQRITVDPDICHGKPTIRGLRYPIEMILGLISAGMTKDEILTDYPDLEREDLLTVRRFAENRAGYYQRIVSRRDGETQSRREGRSPLRLCVSA